MLPTSRLNILLGQSLSPHLQLGAERTRAALVSRTRPKSPGIHPDFPGTPPSSALKSPCPGNPLVSGRFVSVLGRQDAYGLTSRLLAPRNNSLETVLTVLSKASPSSRACVWVPQGVFYSWKESLSQLGKTGKRAAGEEPIIEVSCTTNVIRWLLC